MSQTLFIKLFGMPGGPELIIIVVIVLLLFGGKKIPELMRGLGKGIREFNNAKSNIKSEIDQGMREIESPKQEEMPKQQVNQAKGETTNENQKEA